MELFFFIFIILRTILNDIFFVPLLFLYIIIQYSRVFAGRILYQNILTSSVLKTYKMHINIYIYKLSWGLEMFGTFKISIRLCPEIWVNKNPWILISCACESPNMLSWQNMNCSWIVFFLVLRIVSNYNFLLNCCFPCYCTKYLICWICNWYTGRRVV